MFGRNIRYLREEKGLKQEEMTIHVGVKNKTLSNYERGNTEPDLETLVKFSKFFGVSINELLTTNIEFERTKELIQKQSATGQPSNYPDFSDMEPNNVVADAGSLTRYGNVMIPVVETYNLDDTQTNGDGHTNYIGLPTHLSRSGAKYIAIKIKGNAMSPTLLDGSYMIVRKLDKNEWPSVIDDQIYLVHTTSGEVHIKRIKNQFRKKQFILTSDNPDKSTFASFNIDIKEINALWEAEWYLANRMPDMHDPFFERLKALEEKMEMMEKRRK